MSDFIFALIIIIMISLIFIIYLIINLLRINLKNLHNNGGHHNSSVLKVQTNKMDGQQFPLLYVKDENNNQVALNINEKRETILLLTSAGCHHCDKLLQYISKYNLRQLTTDIILISYFYPDLPKDMVNNHIILTNKVNIEKHYFMYGDDNLQKLSVDSFPTIIKSGTNRKIIGIYKAETNSIDRHFNFS